MPNHIYNIVTFRPPERAQQILRAVEMEGCGLGSVDFEKLIPMPQDVYRGPLGTKEMRQYPGELNWYDWSIDHWGSKWNAYGFDELPRIENALVFETAWSSVPAVIAALSQKFPDVTVSYSWADEDFGSNTGQLVFQRGQITDTFLPEDRSPQAFAFAAAVQGTPEADLAAVAQMLSSPRDAQKPQRSAARRNGDAR